MAFWGLVKRIVTSPFTTLLYQLITIMGSKQNQSGGGPELTDCLLTQATLSVAMDTIQWHIPLHPTLLFIDFVNS